ncbi:MAG: tRNA (5-methylaminomethyl-2-thiouridine)(34)-methyltransferase MnmD [Bacteroidetes bacterium]|nr:tRNA (5-methylaminomethyl-2-thiouridine)(34)-methyltransferase MnmD [Bacteroidota bacterium]
MMKEKDSHPISFLVTDDRSHTLFSERFKATYHSTQGAVSESKHVFIQNGLHYVHEQLGQQHISILEVGFGTGLNAFLSYVYAKEKGLKIEYHSVEAYPVPLSAASELNYTREFTEAERCLFNQLHQQEWNKAEPISDSFSFIKHLTLLEEFKPSRQFQLIYFDAFSPSEQPHLWTKDIFENMHQSLNTNGVLVTYCAQGQMKRNMKQAGFKVTALPGFGSKREMTRAERFDSI